MLSLIMAPLNVNFKILRVKALKNSSVPSRGPLDQGQSKELYISSNHLLKTVTQDLNSFEFF